MTGEPGADAPQDVAVRWTLTLIEPLLPLRRRQHLEDQMLVLCAAKPRWAAQYLGGLAATLAATLPGDDPWRHLTARWGTTTIGENPPANNGARNTNGNQFGTVDDHIDITGQVLAAAEVDPSTAAVADTIEPAAAYAIAAAGSGNPDTAAHLLLALSIEDGATAPTDADDETYLARVVSIGGRRHVPGRADAILGRAGTTAIRHIAHRRRAWLGTSDDPFIPEAATRWALLAGRPLTDTQRSTLRETISRHQITDDDLEF